MGRHERLKVLPEAFHCFFFFRSRPSGVPSAFPNLSKIIKIALTLPLTSASAERSFSKLKIIKNRLRSTMRQDRLESLMLMSVESDICRDLDIEGLVERFTDAAPRRWNLY